MLENLLGNAWKYTANTENARIGLARRPGETTGFTVHDNGAGFDMRYADRLFGVFQRLHSASEFPGTGVGLASVRRIVRRHGGEVWAEAEPERGARFHFTLPLASRGDSTTPLASRPGRPGELLDGRQQELCLGVHRQPGLARQPQQPRRRVARRANSGASGRRPPSPHWCRARSRRPGPTALPAPRRAPRRPAFRCCANAASTAGTICLMSSGLTR